MVARVILVARAALASMQVESHKGSLLEPGMYHRGWHEVLPARTAEGMRARLRKLRNSNLYAYLVSHLTERGQSLTSEV